MNKIINNLAQIASAAEYFDKKTGAAWKIRSCLTNMLVWAANSYLYALKSEDAQRIFTTRSALATLRVWARDSNASALVLDLTPASVRKTLGLERVVDVHEEAVRSARMKCIQTRSALHFKKYYDDSIAAFEEQRRAREESVETIAELLSGDGFTLSPEDEDDMRTFEGLNFSGVANDIDLYDDQAVERQADTLAECVGNALEAMYDVCDGELAVAVTTDKVNRLSGYHKAIMNMMLIAGVDTKKLAERRARLEQLIEAQIATVSKSVKDIDTDIEAQIAQMVEPKAESAPQKPKRVRVPKVKALADLKSLAA